MKTLKRMVAILLAVMMVVSLAACGKQEEPENPDVKKDGKFGGTLKLVTVKDINDAGFPVSGGTDQNVVANTCLERLGNYDEKGNIVGYLAKEIITDPDNLTLTLKLQEGIKYHDGTPFNAQAVVDVWDILIANGQATHFTNVVSKEATGEYEVTVKFQTWRADIVEKLCINCGQMFSPTAYKEHDIEWLKTHLVGTGAFVQDEFVIGEKATFNKNENYWQKDAEGKQLPYLDRIEWIVCQDETAAANILKTGDANLILYPNRDSYSDLLTKGFVRYGIDSCANIGGIMGMFFASGFEGQSVTDVRVRKAICYAIDNEALTTAFTAGLGVPINQLGVKGTREYNDNVKGYPYDVQKAKDLLAEAGYKEGECEVTLTFTPAYQDLYTAIQNMLTAAGFKVVLDAVGSIGDRMVIASPTLDPYKSCCWWSAPSGVSAWYRYFSDKPTTMVHDVLDLKEAGVMDLYDRIMTAKTAEEQKALIDEFQILCVDELCLFCPFYSEISYFIGDDTIQDSQFGMLANTQWDPAHTWLKK